MALSPRQLPGTKIASPSKARGLRGDKGDRSGGSGGGAHSVTTLAALVLVACAAVFGLGLALGLASSPGGGDNLASNPAYSSHLLRVSGHAAGASAEAAVAIAAEAASAAEASSAAAEAGATGRASAAFTGYAHRLAEATAAAEQRLAASRVGQAAALEANRLAQGSHALEQAVEHAAKGALTSGAGYASRFVLRGSGGAGSGGAMVVSEGGGAAAGAGGDSAGSLHAAATDASRHDLLLAELLGSQGIGGSQQPGSSQGLGGAPLGAVQGQGSNRQLGGALSPLQLAAASAAALAAASPTAALAVVPPPPSLPPLSAPQPQMSLDPDAPYGRSPGSPPLPPPPPPPPLPAQPGAVREAAAGRLFRPVAPSPDGAPLELPAFGDEEAAAREAAAQAAVAADAADAAKSLAAAERALGPALFASAPATWRRLLGEDAEFAAAAVSAWSRVRWSPPGPMERFLSSGGTLPVVILAANRPALLRATLTNFLTTVRGAKASEILVFQDGTDASVAAVCSEVLGKAPEAQNTRHSRDALTSGANHGVEGAKVIAESYRFALAGAFAARPDAPGIIVAEDDFLFSPDFLEYFSGVAPLLERDPTTFVASAWNDNGLKGKVFDKAVLCRTQFFPGLGWLLPRALWEAELAAKWPLEHWDHWMRQPKQHKGREAVYPEVNRDYHAGQKGTFMDDYHHNRYFKDIDYNTDAAFGGWAAHRSSGGGGASSGAGVGGGVGEGGGAAAAVVAAPAYVWGLADVYEARVAAVLKGPRTLHLDDLEQLTLDASAPEVLGSATGGAHSASAAGVAVSGGAVGSGGWGKSGGSSGGGGSGDGGRSVRPTEVVVWHDTQLTTDDPNPPFKPMADFFHVWHEWFRAAHKACIHHFRWGDGAQTLVTLVNVRASAKCPYAHLKPSGARVFSPADFDKQQPPLSRRVLRALELVPAVPAGQSCDDACAAHAGKEGSGGGGSGAFKCEARAFAHANTCDALRAAFPCDAGCEENFGLEQPCFVVPSAPEQNLPAACLTTNKPRESTCAAGHRFTRRLCPCVPA